jgi:hypothetical protein
MKIILISVFIENNEVLDNVIDRIKRFGKWARLNNYLWAIKTETDNVFQIRDTLMALMANPDRLFVVDITKSDWGSYNIPQEVANWLKEK